MAWFGTDCGWQSSGTRKEVVMDQRPQSTEALANEVLGVLARSIPARLVEISRSGCLLESRHRVDDGTVGELRLIVGGELLRDDVRVTRCVLVEGSGSSYLVGAEFVQTRRPGESSIRRAVSAVLRGVVEQQRVSPPKKSTQGNQAGLGTVHNGHEVSTGEGVMRELLARFVREDKGQDIIEYALLAGLITTAIVTFITTIGGDILTLYTNLSTAVGTAVP
jgi:pilus assembly protein Flp/PilA